MTPVWFCDRTIGSVRPDREACATLPQPSAEPVTEATSARPGEVDVRLTGLRKAYGAVVAVDGVDLDVGRGEFFTMLGPSGSGKTTTLRLIAGFEQPDAGTVELGGTT